MKTDVKEKEQAKADYNEAVNAGITAFLGEQVKADIFCIKVGQLKPGSTATVTLKYLSELPAENGAVRLTVPTTIAPRYVPPTDNTEAAKHIAAIPHTWSSPVSLTFDLEAVMRSKIKSVKSPSHKLSKVVNTEEDERHVAR